VPLPGTYLGLPAGIGPSLFFSLAEALERRCFLEPWSFLD